MSRVFYRSQLLLCLFICTIINVGYAYSNVAIKIQSQKDFDSLSGSINTALSNGTKEIVVKIYPGTYHYKEDHIDLSGKNYPEASIKIKGRNTTFIASGVCYDKTDAYIGTFNPKHTVLNDRNEAVEIWTPFYQITELIEVVSPASKLCRVKNISNASNISHAGSYIQITSWFQSYLYKINRIEEGYIYFTADNLAKGYREGWNVNNDYNYGKCYPRYRLANVQSEDNNFFIGQDHVDISSNIHSIYECNATRFLVLGYQTYLKSVDIEGITFVGNSYDGEKGVFSFLSPHGRAVINNCQFKGIQSSRVISIGNKNNVSVLNCQFEDCSESGVISSLGTENTVVSNCKFVRCGTSMKNSFCVRCFGVDFLVSHNTFEDFGYSAIGIGCGYGNKRSSRISGVVDHNMLRYTDGYKKCKDQHTLMDGGAIYIFTQNDDTKIRYNYIDGYTGMKDNRGVFCDDGASNLKIYGNVITDIDNSYCIDSRRVASVETQVGPSNVGNLVYDNIVDGTIKIEGREVVGNGCEYGSNFFLVGLDKTKPHNVINNVYVTGEDVVLKYTGMKRGKVGITRASYKRLKKISYWNGIKKFVVKKDN